MKLGRQGKLPKVSWEKEMWLILIMHWSNVYYKVTVNTESANNEHGSQGKPRVRFLWASAHNIPITQSIRNLILCELLLKERHLTESIVDSFTLNLGPTVWYLMPEKGRLPNSCIFHCKARWTSLELSNAKRHFSTALGGHFKQWSRQQKITKMKENVAPSLPGKGRFSCGVRTETRWFSLLDSTRKLHVSWLKFFAALHVSVSVKASQVLMKKL